VVRIGSTMCAAEVPAGVQVALIGGGTGRYWKYVTLIRRQRAVSCDYEVGIVGILGIEGRGSLPAATKLRRHTFALVQNR
jgi:hypothetical protein